MKILHESYASQGQNTVLDRVVIVDGRVYRVLVRADSSYPQQSQLRVEVWTPAGWAEVLHPLGMCYTSQMAAMSSYDRDQAKVRRLTTEFSDELLLQARRIVGAA